MNLIPAGTHTHIHTDAHTKKENFQPCASKSWSIAKLAFGQYLRTNWQMSKGFDGRVLEGREKKKTLIRMCCSYCVCF